MAKFLKEEGVTLENHVIATVTAADHIKCRWDGVDTPLCFSVNVRKLGLTGRVTCELNNSSKTADPHDFMPSAGTQYHQMAVNLTILLRLLLWVSMHLCICKITHFRSFPGGKYDI